MTKMSVHPSLYLTPSPKSFPVGTDIHWILSSRFQGGWGGAERNQYACSLFLNYVCKHDVRPKYD